MRFTILPQAELEAASAAIWYDDQRSGLGDEFLVELAHVLDRIHTTPHELPRLECYSGSHEVRRCILKRFPYVVSFLCRANEVVVVAIGHARRRPLYWLDRLP